MTIKILSSLVLATLVISPASAQTEASPAEIRDMGTPKPATPTWENERDLIVLLENAQDRVALAQQVMAISLTINNTLSPQQRFDGLTIAGHTFWTEAMFDSAISCFDGAIALNIDDLRTADSARMKAQSLNGLARYSEAVDAYQLCYAVSHDILSRGEFTNMIGLIMVPYIGTAHAAGDTTLALELVDEVLQNYTTYGNGNEIRSMALDEGARTALDANLNQQAELYLTTLLNDYPDFGTEFPGLRVNLEMNLIKAQGFTLENQDSVAIAGVMDIIKDDRFFGMPIWAWHISQLTNILDKNDSIPHANKLRLWAVDKLDEKASSLSAGDPNTLVYQMMIQRSQITLLSRLGVMLTDPDDTGTRIAILDRITTEFAEFDPGATQKAQRTLDRLLATP